MTTRPDRLEGSLLEKEQSRYRRYRGRVLILTKTVAVGTALLSLLYVSGALPSLGVHLLTIQHNAIFMAGILTLLFLLHPARKGEPRDRLPWHDIPLISATLAGTIYIIVNALEIDTMGRFVARPIETVLGLIIVVAVLEAVRRTVGWPMVVVSLAFILYARFSYLLPGILSAHLQTWPRIVAEVYLSPSGMFGALTTLASSIIIAFMAFGAFFMKVGGGQVFLDLALSITGSIRGGPAKAAIVGSAMFGTVSGSPAANVVVTGTITIPLMKRTGYSPTFAGAVEAVASTGGIIMPPVMGATAFIMASLLGVSYATVALAAAIPGTLYFVALFLQTDLRAAKDGLRGIPRSELPPFWATLKRGWQFGIPLLLLILLLFVLRYPPAIAASYTVGSLVVIGLFQKQTRLDWRGFVDALEETATSMFMVAPVIAASGIIMSTLTMTGLGPKLASGLVDISGGNVLILVFLAGIACYIMGMGVNIIVTYILLVLLVAPALETLGVPKMATHFFIFYMGASAFFTPPYAPAAFVASAISGASPNAIGFQAMRLGIVTFLVPFILIYNPAFILMGTPAEIVLAIATGIIGIFALSVGIEGYLLTKANWLQRVFALGAGLTMMTPHLLTNVIGMGLLGVVIIWQWRSRKTLPTAIK